MKKMTKSVKTPTPNSNTRVIYDISTISTLENVYPFSTLAKHKHF